MMTFQLRVTEKMLSKLDSDPIGKLLREKSTCGFVWYHDQKISHAIPERIADGESEVVFVQADGHELEWIRENISGIRMSKNRVIRWTGNDATFIVNSLPVDWNK